MKKYIILTTLFATLLLAAPIAIAQNAEQQQATAADPDLSEKLILAKEYSASVPLEEEVNQAIDGLIINVPKEQRLLFKSILQQNLKIPQLTSVSEMALAETFTLAELKALVAFYKTAEGQAIKAKMPLYKERLAPTLDQMVRDSIESFERQAKP